jgi:S-adenosylmethionine:tRNA ribosyltransferase-isomerase
MEIVTASSGCTEASLTLSDFQFTLPPELIAQTPAEKRDSARLMVLNRRSGSSTHARVRSLPEHLRPGDLLVVNDTRVIPARLFGRTESGAAVEILLIRPLANSHTEWLGLGKPARRLRAGTRLTFAGNVHATLASVRGDGRYHLVFDERADVLAWLALHGEIPLPPYIRRPDGPLPLDRTRYQTIFAATPGAIAAPTAGLHFSAALVAALQARGIEMARLTLHVGPGTFLPVRCDNVRQHVMESEWYDIPTETAAAIHRVKAGGGRVVAVGTTTTRALESAAADAGGVRAGANWAELFIVPGHRFRVVDALFTNFHLPGSTLLLLVSAFAGRGRILDAYGEAVHQGYRFYSYGDAMLIQ